MENKPKISVIIPYMESDEGKQEVLERLLDSLVGADEIIVVENFGAGYAVPINFGFSQATGDYLMVLNDDLKMDRGGDIHDLCDPNFVTSPTIDGNEQNFWGCAFILPRWVYEMTEGLNEYYRISYYDDDDFLNKLRTMGIPTKCMPFVNFWNVDGGGRTLHTFSDMPEWREENRLKFIEMWGAEPPIVNAFYEKNGRLPRKEEL